ncbi:hypothetical protein ALISP_1710 [Alicycliphilus sp. B1]|nr:hypothetical protein ALISP_1710 [Alicycliphilus sp. B1]
MRVFAATVTPALHGEPERRGMGPVCDALDITPSDLLKDIERRMRVQGKALTPPLR